MKKQTCNLQNRKPEWQQSYEKMTKFSCKQRDADLNNTEVGHQRLQHSPLMAATSGPVTPDFRAVETG